jgi:hypothetical protein
MKIKRFQRKSKDQLKDEIRDAFSELIDSYDFQIRNSQHYLYNFVVSIKIPENVNGNMFNLGRFQSQNLEEVNNAIDVIKSQSNVLVDILSLVKDSISKLEDQTKSYVIKVDSDEYTGPDRILIHFRMYFT